MGNNQEFITYKDAIEASIKSQFPKLNDDDIDIHVFKKLPLEDDFKPPLILFGVPLMQKSPLCNDLQFWLRINNTAYIVTSVMKDKFSLNAQQLSTNLGNFIHGNQWGVTGPADVSAILPDDNPVLDPYKYNTQRIDFTQDLLIIDKE